jgi:CRISPR system Cascade subunit CasE
MSAPALSPTTGSPASDGGDLVLWRATIPLLTRHARLLAQDAHALHRLVLTAYPAHADTRATHDVLWRADTRGNTLDLTVQAAHAPDPDRVAADRGWRTDWLLTDPRPLTGMLNRLTEGAPVQFQIRANPSKAQFRTRDTRRGRDRGVRTPITDPADQLAWLTQRLSPGLTVGTDGLTGAPAIAVTDPGSVRGRKPNGEHITYRAADFQGLATVTDPTVLTDLIRSGIGRGRPYGLGLLQVLPLA